MTMWLLLNSFNSDNAFLNDCQTKHTHIQATTFATIHRETEDWNTQFQSVAMKLFIVSFTPYLAHILYFIMKVRLMVLSCPPARYLENIQLPHNIRGTFNTPLPTGSQEDI
jgi:hypothetical protein